MIMVQTQAFDTARHLDNPEVIAWYLADAFETRDSRIILNAIRNVARAGNMAKIARATGMSRTSLYWRKDTSPEFTTVLRVLSAVGVGLVPKPQPRTRQRRAREDVVIAGTAMRGLKAPRKKK
jgi:probable addiction module antidote protein